jgi:hypothetical protein
MAQPNKPYKPLRIPADADQHLLRFEAVVWGDLEREQTSPVTDKPSDGKIP